MSAANVSRQALQSSDGSIDVMGFASLIGVSLKTVWFATGSNALSCHRPFLLHPLTPVHQQQIPPNPTTRIQIDHHSSAAVDWSHVPVACFNYNMEKSGGTPTSSSLMTCILQKQLQNTNISSNQIYNVQNDGGKYQGKKTYAKGSCSNEQCMPQKQTTFKTKETTTETNDLQIETKRDKFFEMKTQNLTSEDKTDRPEENPILEDVTELTLL
ncbi:uncharacterized protein G2W53_029380 [Senna tora]|uniref:Uncharacterized protein n=1 Tax=Senna tora TaxID=362788 RepID=A0A834T5C7_9FABA|nr:uncharacterized protein G2W53_029380 [Senna tora]